jgi:hypothetical protein
VKLGFLLFFAPAAAFGRAARRRLRSRFPDGAARVWLATRAWQSRLAPHRPRHGGGVNLTMRYMEWSCALYRAVREDGMSQAEAAALVETVMSDVYRPVPAALFKLSRLRGGNRETRVKWLLGMMPRYFFSAPFRYRAVPSKTDVAWDVLRCPLADYFRDQGVPELTRHAACKMDYHMAREWGVDLVRSQTIAEGAAHCDFRFKFPAAGAASRAAGGGPRQSREEH